MLIPPRAGRNPRNIENDVTESNAVRRAIHAVQTRPSGSGAGNLTNTAPQGAGIVDGDGNSLVGTLGFALGFSGFGGDDWLYPADQLVEAPERFYGELT